jgi:hypothetical protein
MTHAKLLQQYADTGAIVPQYQIQKLNASMQKTYLRRRALQALEDYYYALKLYEVELFQEIDEKGYIGYLEKKSKTHVAMTHVELDILNRYRGGPNYQNWLETVKAKDSRGLLYPSDYVGFTDETFSHLSPDTTTNLSQRGKVLRKLRKPGTAPQEIEQYFLELFKDERDFNFHKVEWEIVSEELLDKYFEQFIERAHIATMPPRLRDGLLMRSVVKHGLPIKETLSLWWQPEEVSEALEWLIENDIMRISYTNVNNMRTEMKRKYVDKSKERHLKGLPTSMRKMLGIIPVNMAKEWEAFVEKHSE